MYVLFYLLFHPIYYYYGFIHVSYIIRNDDISMHVTLSLHTLIFYRVYVVYLWS